MIPTAIVFGVVVAASRPLLPQPHAGVYQAGALLVGAVVWGLIVTVGELGGIVLGAGGFLLALVNALLGYGVAVSAKWLLRNLANARQR